MKMNFGIVEKYFIDRGFGFVTHVFPNSHSKKVFFHIKTIKRLDLELAKKIDDKNYTGAIYFWYETESSKKGEQICAVLNHENIYQEYLDTLPTSIEKIESIWRDINLQTPEWLLQVSIDLIGVDRTSELKTKRDELELKRNENKCRKERVLQEIEFNEFQQLIAEITPLGFTHSSQVSSYIIENQLGYKYKNISGIIEMEREGHTWKFKGGFPNKIYAQICSELNLENKGSNARVVGFKPFKKFGE